MKQEITSAIIDYKGSPRFIKLAYTRDPNSDQWNLYNENNVPTTSLRMPKGWQPSNRVRVNGVLGK